MAYDTKYQGPVKISLADQDVGFGSCEITDDYGEVQSASISREADAAEFRKCNNDLLAVVMTNHRFQFTFEVLWSEDKPLPGIHERVAFPGANTQGRIQTVTRRWSQNGAQLASITATSWDAMRGSEVARSSPFSGVVTYIGPEPGAADYVGYRIETTDDFQETGAGGVVSGTGVFTPTATGLEVSGFTPADMNGTYVPHEVSGEPLLLPNIDNAVVMKNGEDYCCIFSANSIFFWDQVPAADVEGSADDTGALGFQPVERLT